MPQRIVSLAPSITETIFAIGVEGHLVGVTAQCQYPPKVVDLLRNRRLTFVGSYSRTNLERVTALTPDLVVATRHTQKSTLKKLQEDGFDILVLDYPKMVEGIFDEENAFKYHPIHWIVKPTRSGSETVDSRQFKEIHDGSIRQGVQRHGRRLGFAKNRRKPERGTETFQDKR